MVKEGTVPDLNLEDFRGVGAVMKAGILRMHEPCAPIASGIDLR